MSTQINHYIGYGILMTKAEWEELTKEKTEEWHEKLHKDYLDSAYNTEIAVVNGFTFVSNIADDDFYFYGKVYAKGAEDEPLETAGIDIPSQELKYDLFYAYQKIFGVKPSKDAQFVVMTVYR